MPVVHGAIGCGEKSFMLSEAVPPAPVRAPRQKPLAPTVTSVMWVANDKSYNEMIPEPVVLKLFLRKFSHRYRCKCIFLIQTPE